MMIDSLARIVVRRAAWVLAGLLLVTAAASALATQVRFDFSPQSMFTGDDDLVRNAERAKRIFGYEDAVLMVGLEAVGEKDVVDRHVLTWQAAIADEFDALPRVEEVQSLARLKKPQVVLSPKPGTELVPVVRNFPVDRDDEDRLRLLLDKTELLEGSLISHDHRLATLLVFVDPEARAIEDMAPVVEGVQNLLAEQPPPDGYRAFISGLPAVRTDIVRNLQEDQALLIPIGAALYLIALGLVFRRLSGTVIPLVAVGMGLAWTLAAVVATNQSLNIVSNVLPMLLLIIGVSNCVHVICRYAEESERLPGDRQAATCRTISQMAVACFVTLLTTAVGFMSLWAARSNALQSFGSQAAIGLGFLYVAIICTLGASLAYFRPPRFRRRGGRRPAWLFRIMTAAGFAAVKHPAITLLGSTGLVLAALWAARNVEINSYAMETYDENHPTMRTIRLIEDRLGGMLPLEIVLTSDDSDQFLTPQTYRKVATLQQYAVNLDAVVFGRSYVDLHQEIEARVTGKDELRDRLPPLGEEGQRRIDRSTRFIRKSAEQLHYRSFISPDGKHARVLLKVRDVGTKRLTSLIDDIQARLGELFPENSGVEFLLTGDAYLNTRAMESMIRDLLQSLLVASLVIMTIIAVLFRSIRIALITSIPNLTPLVLTAGYMGLRGFDMNAGNVIVFTISLGIAVDNTVHLLIRFREEAANHDAVHAVQRALQGTGRAIVITGLLVVLGLAVLLLSDFVPTRRFAELVSVTMLGALVGDLLLLPACLVLFWRFNPLKRLTRKKSRRASLQALVSTSRPHADRSE